MRASRRPEPGLGIDVVEIHRIARILARRPAFGARYFGPAERCLPPRDHAAWYARCFAAKEAFVKALGMGVLDVPLGEIQLIVKHGHSVLECGPEILRVLDARGYDVVRVTTGCDGRWAMAWVLLMHSTAV